MKKRLAMLSAIFLAAIIAIAGRVSISQTMVDFSVVVDVDGKSEKIDCWKDDEANLYVFLPSYADLSQAEIRLHTANKLYADDVLLEDGMKLSGFQLGKAYTYQKENGRDTVNSQLFFCQSSGIASMHISTQTGSMDYIHQDKENKETGSLRVYTADGRIDYSGDIEEFKGRGNSTWVDHEKKPYNLTLPVPDELLGMEAGKRWILLANAYDPSHLCNVLVTQSAREIGLNYTPDSAWVDLYLNGEYAGLYLLSEKNEVANGRVTISGESGYLVSLERRERLVEGNKLYVSTLADQALRIHYPLLTESEQMQRIADVFQTAENAILAEEGIDPITQKHWADIIDLDSWVKKYLIDEIFANTDGGALSQYFYYTDTDSERKIYAGPVWDYDTTLGNEVPWQINHPESFYANRPSVKDGENTPWYHALYSKPVFYQRVTEIFEEELLPVITVLLDENIDAYVQKIRSSAAMNSIRWSLNNSLDNEVSRLKTFLAQRLQFLSEIWLEDAEFCMLQINPGANKHIVYQAVRPGATPPTLPTLENNQYQNFLGWYYSDTNEPFDPTKPIYSDLELYAKWEDSSSKKMGQIIKLIPLGVIGMMGAMMLAVEWRRGRKGR